MCIAAAFLGIAWLLSAQGPPKPEDLCSVEGQVTDSATGAPLKKAAILMARIDAALSPRGTSQSYSAITDASGKFAIKEIEPGKYRLQASRNGFVTMSYGARSPARAGTTLTLVRGKSARDIHFRLLPHGVVSGRIVDEDGDGVVNVPVQLLRFRYLQGRRQLTIIAGRNTDDRGEFRIFGVALPDGSYVKSIRSGNTDVLTEGLDTTRGAPAPLEIAISPKAAFVSGVVQNPRTGNPSPSATVALIPREKERQQPQFYRTMATDQNGTYTFPIRFRTSFLASTSDRLGGRGTRRIHGPGVRQAGREQGGSGYAPGKRPEDGCAHDDSG